MMTLTERILDLPVIIQGALGSGLFWLFLESGQRLLRVIADFQRNTNMQRETALDIALGSVLESDPESRRMLFQGMVHGALHNIVAALIFLCCGLILDSLIPVFGFVGYVGALFYLFRALAYVPDFNRWKGGDELRKLYHRVSKGGA